MYRVTGVQPLSWAKTYTLATIAIVAVAVLLVLVPLLVISGFAAIGSGDAEEVGGYFGMAVLMVVVALAFAGAVSLVAFVASLIQGAVFNWALGHTGGVQIELAADRAPDTGETVTAGGEGDGEDTDQDVLGDAALNPNAGESSTPDADAGENSAPDADEDERADASL